MNLEFDEAHKIERFVSNTDQDESVAGEELAAWTQLADAEAILEAAAQNLR